MRQIDTVLARKQPDRQYASAVHNAPGHTPHPLPEMADDQHCLIDTDRRQLIQDVS